MSQKIRLQFAFRCSFIPKKKSQSEAPNELQNNMDDNLDLAKSIIRKNAVTVKLVRKANELVEARYKFDIWETRATN